MLWAKGAQAEDPMSTGGKLRGRRDKSTHTHKKVLKGNSDRTLVPVIVLTAMMTYRVPGQACIQGGDSAVFDGIGKDN